jgi:PAS domain-containing protein
MPVPSAGRSATEGDELLRAVAELLPVGVFALDADARVVLWNADAERLTGWPRDAVLGRAVDGVATARALTELRAGRPVADRLTVPTPSGRRPYVRAAPLPGWTGAAAVGVLLGEEDGRAGDEAFALLDALWETAPVGLAYFDTELRYRRINGAVLAIDGGTVDQRLGRTLEDVHGETGAVIAEGLRGVLADGRPRLDVPVSGRLWHGRGPRQEWRMSYYPVQAPGGARLGVGVVLVDVTAAERTRRELAELAAERAHTLVRYQSLVEATSAAVWIRDAAGRAVEDAPGSPVRSTSGRASSTRCTRPTGPASPPPGTPRLPASRRCSPTSSVCAPPPATPAGTGRGRCRSPRPAWCASGSAPRATSTTRSAPGTGSTSSPGRPSR